MLLNFPSFQLYKCHGNKNISFYYSYLNFKIIIHALRTLSNSGFTLDTFSIRTRINTYLDIIRN